MSRPVRVGLSSASPRAGQTSSCTSERPSRRGVPVFARWLHDELLRTYPPAVTRVRLRVFAQNLRARRFYEKCGWMQTGVTSRTQFEPYPLLIEYVRWRG